MCQKFVASLLEDFAEDFALGGAWITFVIQKLILSDTKLLRNNSLRIIFRNFEAILYPQNLRERRTFSRNYA